MAVLVTMRDEVEITGVDKLSNWRLAVAAEQTHNLE